MIVLNTLLLLLALSSSFSPKEETTHFEEGGIVEQKVDKENTADNLLPTKEEIFRAMLFNGLLGKPSPKFSIASKVDSQQPATQCPPIGNVRFPDTWRSGGDEQAMTSLVHEVGHWKQCLENNPIEECVPSRTARDFAYKNNWPNVARIYEDYLRTFKCEP